MAQVMIKVSNFQLEVLIQDHQIYMKCIKRSQS